MHCVFENLPIVTYIIMYNYYVVKVKMYGHCLIQKTINHIYQMSNSFKRMLKKDEKSINIEKKCFVSSYNFGW